MTVVLDDRDVAARVDAHFAVVAMREALVAAYRGDLQAPPRVRAGVLTFTCGRVAGRWYGYRSYDTHMGGQQLVVVHAEPTGEVAGIAVGSALGMLRTGALGGAAVDALARPDASSVGIVGAGRQAWAQLWAIASVRSLSDVAVSSRRPATAFAARATAEFGVRVRAVETARAAVEERDIVVLATSSATPVVDAGWLSPGTAVTTVGPKQVGRAEFALDLPGRSALVVTDSPAQLGSYDPPALLAGTPAIHLGAIIAGDHAGRAGAEDVTLYASVGLAGTEPYLLARLLDL